MRGGSCQSARAAKRAALAQLVVQHTRGCCVQPLNACNPGSHKDVGPPLAGAAGGRQAPIGVNAVAQPSLRTPCSPCNRHTRREHASATCIMQHRYRVTVPASHHCTPPQLMSCDQGVPDLTWRAAHEG